MHESLFSRENTILYTELRLLDLVVEKLLLNYAFNFIHEPSVKSA